MRVTTVTRCRIGDDMTTVVKATSEVYEAELRCLLRLTKEMREAWLNDREPDLSGGMMGIAYADLSTLIDILTGEEDYLLKNYREI